MNDTDLPISISGLSARYGLREVLSDLDLEVPAGSVTALVGSNGAGKSTLLKTLIGVLKPRAGEVRVLGLDPRRKGVRVRREVGFVPDNLEVPRWMTVRDHLRFLEPFHPTWDRSEAQRLCDLFELDQRRKIAELSKGQRTLQALVAALAHRPNLLLLDEPFSGLDVIARRRVLTGVLEHLREDNKSALLVSHSLVDVERAADRVALMIGGRIAMCDDLDRVQARSARFGVHLDSAAHNWIAPGSPLIEGTGAERILFYLDGADQAYAALEADPQVSAVERLGRDLEDVLAAVAEKGREAAA